MQNRTFSEFFDCNVDNNLCYDSNVSDNKSGKIYSLPIFKLPFLNYLFYFISPHRSAQLSPEAIPIPFPPLLGDVRLSCEIRRKVVRP